jgi:hypothetical protein
MLRRSEPPEVRKPMYWYRCCSKSDVEQVLQSGQTFDLHWLVEADLPTPTPTERYLTLSAALVGPYRDPFLNISDGDVRTLTAPDITADTWEAQELVSSMVLPTDLPNGLYQLRLTWLDSKQSATFATSMGLIRVGA